MIALARAGRRFAECSELAELLSLAADLALENLQADSASVARLEHDRGLLRVVHNVGALAAWEEPHPLEETYALSDFPLLASTVESAATWFGDLEDPQTGESHHELLRAMGMHSSISLPLVVGSTVWGEIGAARTASRSSFSPGDTAVGEAFCGLLAASITRIVERDTLQALAFNDALTGLGNRRAIDDRLERLFADADQHRCVAVVLCDVDGLKRINDLHGHDAGDRVLREVSVLLSRAAGTHPGTLAARLGGDEFCLLLEGVSEPVARAISDELVSASSALSLGARLSAGWARTVGRPGGALTATQAARAVLRLADASQYRTKRSGRMEGTTSAAPDQGAVTALRQRGLDTVLDDLARAPGDACARLGHVAAGLADEIGACAWWVSRSVDGHASEVISYGGANRRPDRDVDQVVSGASFDLAEYPATRAALEGGGFHATISEGDVAEQRFLAAHGYDEIIAAGSRQDLRTAWLVELVGDALSPPLGHALPLLRSLVELAVVGRAAPMGTAPTGYDGSSA